MKNKLLYLTGILSSQLGTHLFLIAMVIWMKEVFNSSEYIGYLLFSSSIASLIFSPFSGVIVDRLKPKIVMVFTDIFSGLSMILLSAVMLGIWPTDHKITIILILAFFNSILASLFAPASLSLVGQIASGDAVKNILSLSSNITESSKIFGRAFAGILTILINPALLVFLNGISFLISAALESMIKIDSSATNKTSLSQQRPSFFIQMNEGFKYLKQNSVLLTLFIGAAGTNMFMAINGPLLPTLIKDIMGLELWWYGVLMSATGVGALIGGFIAGKLRSQNSGRLFIMALIFQGVPFSFVPFASKPATLFGLMFIVGFFFVFVQVHLLTLVNKVVPAEMKGRVFSLMFTVVGLFMPLGYLISGEIGGLSHQAIFNLYYLSGIGIPLVWVFAIFKIQFNSLQALVERNKC